MACRYVLLSASMATTGEMQQLSTTVSGMQLLSLPPPASGLDRGLLGTCRSILLGQAILNAEDTEAFLWVFQRFQKMLADVVPPQAWFTDGDAGALRALKTIFPSSRKFRYVGKQVHIIYPCIYLCHKAVSIP
jgi:hypothetical protein